MELSTVNSGVVLEEVKLNYCCQQNTNVRFKYPFTILANKFRINELYYDNGYYLFAYAWMCNIPGVAFIGVHLFT